MELEVREVQVPQLVTCCYTKAFCMETARVYVLDTGRLKEVLGLSYQEIRSATINPQTVEFLNRVAV